eukprot:6460967-Amphidinium_carterae.1
MDLCMSLISCRQASRDSGGQGRCNPWGLTRPSGEASNLRILSSATRAVVGVWNRPGALAERNSSAGSSWTSLYASLMHSCVAIHHGSAWCGLLIRQLAVAEFLLPAMQENTALAM